VYSRKKISKVLLFATRQKKLANLHLRIANANKNSNKNKNLRRENNKNWIGLIKILLSLINGEVEKLVKKILLSFYCALKAPFRDTMPCNLTFICIMI